RMPNDTKIKCPNCSATIDVQDILAHQLEDEIKQKYQAQLTTERQRYEQEQAKLAQEREAFEQKKRQENELFQQRLETKLREEKKNIEGQLKAKMQADMAEQYDVVQRELQDKSEQLKELHRTKAQIEQLKREKEEVREAVALELQRKMNEQL